MEALAIWRWILVIVQPFKNIRKVDDVEKKKEFRLIPETRQQRSKLSEGDSILTR